MVISCGEGAALADSSAPYIVPVKLETAVLLILFCLLVIRAGKNTEMSFHNHQSGHQMASVLRSSVIESGMRWIFVLG